MAEHEDKNGYKWWQKVLLAIGIFIDVIGVGLFLFSFQYGTKTTDYTIKKDLAWRLFTLTSSHLIRIL